MEFQTDILVEASATEAWRVLGEEFGEIAMWSATLATSSLIGDLGVGAVRTCEGAGFGPFPPGAVSERLTLFDRERTRFTYEATAGLPWFVRSAQNAWSVEPLGEHRCRVLSVATVELPWWLAPLGFVLPLVLKSDMAKFSEELRHQIERGSPHPRKLAMAVR